MHSYLGDKDKGHDECSSYKDPTSEYSTVCVAEIIQCVYCQYDDSQYYTGDVNGSCNPLGIIQTLDLYLPSGKG